MSNPYIGEIRMFAGSFAPAGWALCNGQALPISENDALFTLIGTTYGGDGQETFNLPNLQSRVPIHIGNGVVLGESGGVESVTLTVNQTPAHTHPLLGSTALGSSTTPQNAVLAQDNIAGADLYIEDTPVANMAATAITPVGGSQPHENMQPYLVINYIISLFGIFPQPN
jgi:microcystin-dependent protein